MSIAILEPSAAVSAASTAAPTTAAELETMFEEQLQHDPLYIQAERLLRTGRIDESTTFGDLTTIIERDEIEQRLSCLIDDWFALYCDLHHTPEEAAVACALIHLDMEINPEECDVDCECECHYEDADALPIAA